MPRRNQFGASLTLFVLLSLCIAAWGAPLANGDEPSAHVNTERPDSLAGQSSPAEPEWLAPAWNDFAPDGMPDFALPSVGSTSTCADAGPWAQDGPTAMADLLWWIDSMLEGNAATTAGPGDGVPVVEALGPWDDHDAANVDPLIRRLAVLMNTDGADERRSAGSPRPACGTLVDDAARGVGDAIQAAGLGEEFFVSLLPRPSFDELADHVEQNRGVVLLVGFWEPARADGATRATRIGGHYVAVAGVDLLSRNVAFSDPALDAARQARARKRGVEQECRADGPGCVSHDVYPVLSIDGPGGAWSPGGYVEALGATLTNFTGLNGSEGRPVDNPEGNVSPRVQPVTAEVEFALVVGQCPPDSDGDGFRAYCDGDCMDDDPRVFTDAVELCDGRDNDCDGDIDESFPRLGEPCLFPDPHASVQGVRSCAADGRETVCTAATNVDPAEFEARPARGIGGQPWEDGITLSVGPGGVTGQLALDWVGGSAPWTVYRSTSPQDVMDWAEVLGVTASPNWTDLFPPDDVFYRVGSGVESEGGVGCSPCHGETWSRMNGDQTQDLAGNPIASLHRLGAVAGYNDSPDPASPDATWGAPLDTVPAADRSCANMCHGDHPHTTSFSPITHENNVYRDARTAASRNAADERSSNDVDLTADSDGLCLSCHRYDVSIDGELHRGLVPERYADGSHNAVGGTYGMHDGSSFERNCSKCHGGSGDAFPDDAASPFEAVHYSKYDSLLRRSPRGDDDTTVFLCYTCHGTGSPKDLEQIFGTNTGSGPSGGRTYAHPITEDTIHDSIAERESQWGDSSFFGSNRHVSCLDCHDTHEAGTVLHTEGTNVVQAGSSLYGASGVQWVQAGLAAWASPTAANFAWTDDVGHEYEICLKCHSSYAWGTNDPGSPPAPFGPERTDVAQEFNPNNPRYHAVVGESKASCLGSHLAPWDCLDNLYCSDCHSSDSGTDPIGAHGSDVASMLTRPYTISTGKSGTEGNLCFKCHDFTVYNEDGNDNTAGVTGFGSTNRPNLHSRHLSKGDVSGCVDCHGWITHGWRHEYPVVMLADPSPYNVDALINSPGANWGPSADWDEDDCSTSCH